MELFDLVDENDQVIGTTDKLTSHKDGGIHRVIAIFVFDKNADLLVQEHIKSGGLYDNSVGGHVRQGESFVEAAIREGKEELNIIKKLDLVLKFYSDETYSGKNIRHMFGLFECTPGNDWKFESNNEVKNVIPMKIFDVVEQMNTFPTKFTPGFLNTMYQFVKSKNLQLNIKDYRGSNLRYH